jgi:hypothetical protein
MTSGSSAGEHVGNAQRLASDISTAVTAARDPVTQAAVAAGIAGAARGLAPLTASAFRVLARPVAGDGPRLEAATRLKVISSALLQGAGSAQRASEFARPHPEFPYGPEPGRAARQLARTVAGLRSEAAAAGAADALPPDPHHLGIVLDAAAVTSRLLGRSAENLAQFCGSDQAAAACYSSCYCLAWAGKELSAASEIIMGLDIGRDRQELLVTVGARRPGGRLAAVDMKDLRAFVTEHMAVRRYRAGEPPQGRLDRQIFSRELTRDAGGHLAVSTADTIREIARRQKAAHFSSEDHGSCGESCPWGSRDLPKAERANRARRHLTEGGSVSAGFTAAGLTGPHKITGPPPRPSRRRNAVSRRRGRGRT